MATGPTTSATLADSLDVIVDSARMRRQVGTIMTRLVDNQKLAANTGLAWKEVVFDNLDVQNIDETTELDNFQQYADTPLTIEPAIVGLMTFVTDKARAVLNKKSLAAMGNQPQLAIEKRKDKDGLAVFGSLTAIGAAGTSITAGHVRAAQAQNRVGGGTEEWDGPQASVLHSYQVKVLEDEIEAGVGTYAIPDGVTEEVYRKGLAGMIGQTTLHVDDNIEIDGSDDAAGGTFASGAGGAIIMVQGHDIKTYLERNNKRGGGGEEFIIYDEFKFGIRQSSWGKRMLFDASTPTS